MSAASDVPEAAQGSGPDAGSWPLPWEPVEGNRDGLLATLEAWTVLGAVHALSRLPWGAQVALSRGLARVARTVDRRHTRSARAFVRQALGPELDPARREELVLSAYEHLIRLTLESARLADVLGSERLLEHVEVELSDDARRVRDAGRGALMLTGHVGAWELLPPLVARLGFRPLYVVSRPPRNRPLARAAQRAREAGGYRLLHRHGAAASIPAALAAGASVGLMVDQRARGKTVVAPFFGRPAHCERAVAVFARRLRVPVVVADCTREGGPWRFRARIDTVLWPEDVARLSVEALTARINAELERRILARPEQYFWLHDRYRGAPGAVPGPAAGA